MIQLQIKDIEKKTGKQIRQNAISVGFDTAPAYTGICVLKSDTKTITIEHSQTIATSAKDDHFRRAANYGDAIEKFNQILNKYSGHKIMVIERCFYSLNAEVVIQLAHFGILTYYILKDYFNAHFYYGVTTVRSMIGFNQKYQQEHGTFKAKLYTRDTFHLTGKKKGQIKHKKGEKHKIECKQLVHNYLETDFGLKFDSPDEADAFVLALAGLLS